MAEITELWEAELLASLVLINMDGAWNKHDDANFWPFLIILRKLIAMMLHLFGREEYTHLS